MTGAAHVAVGCALAVAVGDWYVALALAILSHPILDLAGRYHPEDVLIPDTWQKVVLILANAAALIPLLLAVMFGVLLWWQAGIGLVAWLWADVWWAVRHFWPRFDKWNPHNLWWIHNEEHQEHMCALWWELAVMACAVTVVWL